MKKLLLPLLLLLAFGMLLAVESAPSAVVGYVKYDGVAGLNFVAMPMVQAIATTAEFGTPFGDDINTINTWSAEGQYWDASINYGGGFWDPENPLETGSVLYMDATAPFTYYSIGDLPAVNAQYNVVVGLNTVMVPLNRSDLSSTALAGVTMGDGETVNTINTWNSEGQYWDASINYGGGFWDPENTIAIGTPMYIDSGSDFAWPESPRSTTLRSNTKSK